MGFPGDGNVKGRPGRKDCGREQAGPEEFKDRIWLSLGELRLDKGKEHGEVRKLGHLIFKDSDSVFRCKQSDVQFQLERGMSRTVLVTRD